MPEYVYTPNNPEGRRQVTQEDLMRENRRQSDRMAQIALAQLRQQGQQFGQGLEFQRERLASDDEWRRDRAAVGDQQYNDQFEWMKNQAGWQRDVYQQGFDRQGEWRGQDLAYRQGRDAAEDAYRKSVLDMQRENQAASINTTDRMTSIAEGQEASRAAMAKLQEQIANLQLSAGSRREAALDALDPDEANRLALGGDLNVDSEDLRQRRVQAKAIDLEAQLRDPRPSVREAAERRLRSSAALEGVDSVESFMPGVVDDIDHVEAGKRIAQALDVYGTREKELITDLQTADKLTPETTRELEFLFNTYVQAYRDEGYDDEAAFTQAYDRLNAYAPELAEWWFDFDGDAEDEFTAHLKTLAGR